MPSTKGSPPSVASESSPVSVAAGSCLIGASKQLRGGESGHENYSDSEDDKQAWIDLRFHARDIGMALAPHEIPAPPEG